MPTRKITRVGRRVGARGIVQHKLSESASLVDLMTALQQYNIEILPVSPQHGLGVLGRGLSGLVHQSIADLTTTLAFKEGVPSRKRCDNEQDQDWYSLITELTILQHPPIRANPHVVDLLGLAFSVSTSAPTEHTAWPLVVTSKVNRGDLTTIIRDKDSIFLSVESRIVLFAEFMEAVFVLHTCGITHGDLKPDNILVQTTSDAEMNLLLIDFGSSAISGQTRAPTKSEPWNAPELADNMRNLDHHELLQMDLYSFGLVCLHVLLPIQTLVDADLSCIRIQTQTDDQWIQFLSKMRRLKLTEHAGDLSLLLSDVIETSDVPEDIKAVLRIIVEATIRQPSGERYLPWQRVLPHIKEHLSDSYHHDARPKVEPPPLAFNSLATDHSGHRVLQLESILGNLDDVDYVLPFNIYQDLRCKAEQSICETCRLHYAFLCSVCNTIGLGCPRDAVVADEWLMKSYNTKQGLAQAIEDIGRQYNHPGRVSSTVLDALGIGVIVSADRIQEYRISNRLTEAQTALEEKISARESIFGPAHLCLAKPASDLSLILEAQYRLVEAEECLVKASTILNDCLGARHPATLTTRANIANLLDQQGRTQEAEEIALHILPMMEQVLGVEHPETTTTQQILAIIQFNLGKYDEAEQLIATVVESRTEILTSTHPATIRAELTLASVFRAQGRLVEARDLLHKLDVRLAVMLDDDHMIRAQLSIVQAMLHKDMHMFEAAMQKVEAGLLAMDKVQLSADDPLRLDGLEIKASIYGADREAAEQDVILRRILEVKGDGYAKDRETLTTKCLLAASLLAQVRLDDAYSLAEEVLAVTEQSIAEDPENYVAAIDVKANVLAFRGHVDQAHRVRRDVLDRLRTILGNHNVFTLAATSSYGVFLNDRGEYAEAQELFEQILSYYNQTGRPGTYLVRAKRLLARALSNQGYYARAEKECQEGIDWAIRTMGEAHRETGALYNLLGSIYIFTGRISKAEEIYSDRFQEMMVGTEVEPYVLENIAQLRRRQDRMPEARELKRKSEALLKSTFGELHPEVIRMQGNVLSDYMAEPDLFTPDIEQQTLKNIDHKKTILGNKHSSTINTICDLAYAYSSIGRLEEADKLFQDLWDTDSIKSIKDLDGRAKILGKRADVFFQLERFRDAEALEREALEIRLEIFDQSHNSVLVSMCNLASTLKALGEYEEAEGYLRHVVVVREGALQETLPSIRSWLSSRTALGAVLYHEDQLEESADLYATSILVAERIGLPSSIINGWKVELAEVHKKANEENALIQTTPVHSA